MTPSDALADACRHQSENCAYTATSFLIWLRLLRWIRTICNVAPVIFGALATWKIVEQTAPVMAAVCTFLASTIPLAYRAAKVSESIEEYLAAAGEYSNLRDRFQRAANIDGQKPFAEFDGATKLLFERLEKLRAKPLTPPEWSFLRARKKHKAGHYQPGTNGTTRP